MTAKAWRQARWPVGVIAVVVLFAFGFWLGRHGTGGAQSPPAKGDHDHEMVQAELWTCSMHPQIQQKKPGSCPLCGMDLIPVSEDDEGAGEWSLTLSPYAQKLASIEVARVERRAVSREIRLKGRVTPDEKRVKMISSWVPGRIDRLFVDFTGLLVQQGDHMVDIYSPELRSAQVELLEALRSHGRASQAMKASARRRLEAARQKLRLWGVTADQIDAIESREAVTDRLTLFAPIGGFVVKKHVMEGSYVDVGAPIYTLADLSEVWVKLDAYESDLDWLQYGQKVAFEVEAFPGEVFEGRLVFVDPVIDPVTRTASVRVNVNNPGFSLKPDMFVRATVWAEMDGSGHVKSLDLRGKWMCPMHPEEVHDGPGTCGICDMSLVEAESVINAPASPDGLGLPLVIPHTAPLITGEKAVVYVAQGEGRYEGREIRLGHRAGDVYVVLDGLEEGEEVVTKGNFKIDSEMQIRGLTSMMYPPAEPADAEEEKTPHGHPIDAPAGFSKALEPVWKAYFDMHEALSLDRFEPARVRAEALVTALSRTSQAWPVDAEGSRVWATIRDDIEKQAKRLGRADDIEAARTVFEPLSEAMMAIVNKISVAGMQTVYRYNCPMAFDNRGADWLQPKQGTANPYYGSGMFSCGSLVKSYGAPADSEPDTHGDE